MFFWITFGLLNGIICLMLIDMFTPSHKQLGSRKLFDQFVYCSLAWPYLYAKAGVFFALYLYKLVRFVVAKLQSKSGAKAPSLKLTQVATGASMMRMASMIGEPVNTASLRYND